MATTRKPRGSMDVAPMQEVEEAKESVLSKTSPTLDEVEALGDTELRLVSLYDVEKRIGLLARIILEAAMRSRGQMSLKDKADIALRSITVLEGSKQTVEWKQDMLKKPSPKSVEALEKEMKERQERLLKLLTRSKEVQVAEAQAALDAISKDEEDEDEQPEAS